MPEGLIQHGNGLELNVTDCFRATLKASVFDRTRSGPREPSPLPELGCHSKGMTPFHAHRSGSDGEPKHSLLSLDLLSVRSGVAESSDRVRHGLRFALLPKVEACCIEEPVAIAGDALRQ